MQMNKRNLLFVHNGQLSLSRIATHRLPPRDALQLDAEANRLQTPPEPNCGSATTSGESARP
jgi:hypothetical protein